MNRKWWRQSLGISTGLVLALAACQGAAETPTPVQSTAASVAPSAPPASEDASVEGFVSIHGSSTVEPISTRVAEAFEAANAGFGWEVGGEGTGAGFGEFFCIGDSDIADASRRISESETQLCADNGVEWVELRVAYDGITVLTSHDNTTFDCLSYLDLYALTGAESEGFDNWSDANDLATELSAELGDEFGAAHAPYPGDSLDITGPGEESGTFDTYVELVIADIAEAREAEENTRPDYTASANDNTIVEGIEGSASSLGWVGYAFYVENTDRLKAFEIDAGDGCVAPSDETIADGSYPLSRPLFIYVNTGKLAENAALAPFVEFYLNEGIAAVADAGYVDLPDSELDETRSAWADAQ